jgi:2-iminobutanoate/2-iminopropanoate deaminase
MNVIEGSFEEQVETVINNIKNIASDAECTLNDCVKFTVYLKDIENFASVNAVMDNHLEKPYPARAAVEVSRLPKDVEVEIDAILYKK